MEEKVLEEVGKNLIGEYGWLVVAGFVALLLKNTVGNMVAGAMFMFGNDFNVDDIVYIGGKTKSRITRISLQKTTFHIIDTDRKLINLKFKKGCAEKIPVANKSFTKVIAINSLHHWQDYKKGLIEVGRILCPGGSFFISNDIVDGDTCGHGDGPLEKPEHIISIIQKTGFIDISLEKYYNEETGIYLIGSKKP